MFPFTFLQALADVDWGLRRTTLGVCFCPNILGMVNIHILSK